MGVELTEIMINTLARTMFYPSLGYNVILEKIGYTKWYNEFRPDEEDENGPVILLGALPFRSMLSQLKTEGVTRVISVNESRELKAKFITLPKKSDWDAYGIEQKIISACDFVGVPSIEQLDECVEFIKSSKGKIYIHCKAGRCRSATVVAAYLIKMHKKSPSEAFKQIQKSRKHIVLHSIQWDRLAQYSTHIKSLETTEKPNPADN